MGQENMRNASTTFGELYICYQFSLSGLGAQAGVPLTIIDRMLHNLPVSKEHAVKVLNALSLRTREQCTLGNVALKLINDSRPLDQGHA